ncbi:unnamed protein product [Zymoseptoria tritici ST99CH_1E4]|uniref:Uncharacterized protein n=1 Tax=Zymoseptoria tritici ST99CH_1E4 TaxID=1276532 RepID=A0A2H1H834_ZYMTR|nr:unnamed protein product [Zymoseptoria tritici ST99CH_1E4]
MTTPFLLQEHVTTTATTLIIEQKYWSWFKNTGRGFTISKQQEEGAEQTSALLFTAETRIAGKYRTISDYNGTLLFHLQRNKLRKSKGWVLTDPAEKVLLQLRYSWARPHISDVTFGPDKAEPELTIVAKDFWWANLDIVRVTDKVVVGTVRCTNMSPGFLSQFKVTPPIWEVKVTEGTDLALMAVVTMGISDAFSQFHGLLL